MKKYLLFIAVLLLLTGCSFEKEADDNSDGAGNIELQQGILDFGELTYLAAKDGFKAFGSVGVFQMLGGMVCYSEVGTDASAQFTVLCSDLSCRHIHSDSEKQIPVTCEAEAPYGGYVVYHDGYIYAIGEDGDVKEGGLYIHRRKLDGGGWEEVAFICDYLLSEGELVGYQFMRGDKLYLSVLQCEELELNFGTIQNACMGVMEISLTDGTWRMIVPVQKDLYQNAYYLTLLEDDRLLYCYVSSPRSLIMEMEEKTIKQFSDLLIENATMKVCVYDINTEQCLDTWTYPSSPYLQEDDEEKNYFITATKSGVAYVENDTLSYLRLADKCTIELAEIGKTHTVIGQRVTDAIYTKLLSENNEVIESYVISSEGERTDEKAALQGTIYISFDNGYALVQMNNADEEVWLVSEAAFCEGSANMDIYFRYSP